MNLGGISFKLRRVSFILIGGIFLLGLAYAALLWHSKNSSEKRLDLLSLKGDLVSQAFNATSQASLDLMQEIALAEQVISALENKTSNQIGQVRILLQAIQDKSALPQVKVSILNNQGEVLWGSSSKRNIDPGILRLGLFGEERLFAQAGGSFFHQYYLEGISPILKEGKVSGLVHLELPLEGVFLNHLREELKEEIFLFNSEQLQHASLFLQEEPLERDRYLKLLGHDLVQSEIKTAFLELSANRMKKMHFSLTPYASLSVVPLRGLGGEVVAMLVVPIPESPLFSTSHRMEQILFWLLVVFGVFVLLRILIFFTFRMTSLSPRTTVWIFLGSLGLLGIVLGGTKGFEAYLGGELQQQNQVASETISNIYKEYNTFILNSIGEDRERLKRSFIRFLQGEPVEKPSHYEFTQLPLGLKKEATLRVTDSHVPIQWSGTGIFSKKANDPFTRETGIYKVPVGRFAQKLWLVYSSAWGYPNKFGSAYGTKIGSVTLFFDNGNSIAIDLKNGVNIHDRFSPLDAISSETHPSKKALEFVSQEDPLTRLQYVEELEFDIPPVFVRSKIDYLVFEDESSPDVPIFYAVTLGVQKVPAFPSRFATIEETGNAIVLKQSALATLEKTSLVYYKEDQVTEFDFQNPTLFNLAGPHAPERIVQQVLREGNTHFETTSYYGFPSAVTTQPIKEKQFEKPWGMIAVISPAISQERLRQISSLVRVSFFVVLLIVGVVVLGNFIVSWRRLRFKFISYSFVVSCVPLVLVVSLLGYLMWQREEGAARDRVASSLEQSEIFLSDVKTRVQDMALLLSHREELLEALENNDKEKGMRLLNEARLSGLAKFMGGFVVVKFSQGTSRTEQWSTFNYPSLSYGTKRLLERRKSGIFVNQVASLILGVSQEAFSGKGSAQGQMLVYVGVPIDQLFLEEMKRRIGTDLAFYTADTLHSTTMTLSDSSGRSKFRSVAKQQFSTFLKEGENQIDVISLNRGGWIKSFFQRTAVGAFPMKDESNRLVGMMAAFSPSRENIFSTFSAQKVFIFSSFFILALAVLMSTIISRSITKPIAGLAKRADQIAQGELGSVIHINARDEIGDLAQSFNRMSSSLKENHDRLEQKISDLITLQKLSSRVSSVLEKEELMHLIVKIFSELAKFSKGMLLIRDPEMDRFVVESGVGLRRMDFGKVSFLPHDTLAGLALKEQSLIFVENHLEDPRVPVQSVHRLGREIPMMVLAIPLMAKGKEIGAVVLEGSLETAREVRVDEVLLMTLAHHAAIALENAHLYEMAVEDGLTKVFVNRYFQFRLKEEIEHVKRYNTPLSLVLIDLDSFKPVNDNYGHQVGDKILITAAQIMKTTFRSTDVVCRYGGDEFVVILPKTNGNEALRIAERLRKEIEKLDFDAGSNIRLRVTLSVGVAEWQSSLHDKEAFIKAADTALYAAKTAGRNRVFSFDQIA